MRDLVNAFYEIIISIFIMVLNRFLVDLNKTVEMNGASSTRLGTTVQYSLDLMLLELLFFF